MTTPRSSHSGRHFNAAPVIVGSEAHFLKPEERPIPELTHRWRCYVKVDPAVVKSVQFRLHESFEQPVMVADKPPFEIVNYGWGEFNIQIKCTLFNGDKIQTLHHLALHGDTNPVVSESFDTIIYKGEMVPIGEQYNFSPEGAEEEYKQIADAIEFLLSKMERDKPELAPG